MIPGIHDTWDLDPAGFSSCSTGSHPCYYSPKHTSVVSDEGHWDIGSPANAADTNYIRPLNV